MNAQYRFCLPGGEPLHLWMRMTDEPPMQLLTVPLRDLPEEACPEHDGLPQNEAPTQSQEA